MTSQNSSQPRVARRLALALSVALVAAHLAGPASAHPTLEQRAAMIGATYKAVVRVPHGCEGSATTSVSVKIPEGVIGVKPMPKPGWTLETRKAHYEKSYRYFHGAMVSDGVVEVRWSGGKLPDEHYDEFVFQSFLSDELEADKALYFPVEQACEAGRVAWNQIPAAGGDAHALKSPAPSVMLVASKTSAQVKAGDLLIEAPWARATPGGAKVGGGYVKITNNGAVPDRLIGGSLPLAGTVEVHEMAMDNNVMKMRRVDGIEIKPGQTIELKPGGYHLMFMQLKEGLKAGETLKGTLVFEKAGVVEVEFKVAPIGAASPDAKMPGKSGGHNQH